jgi:hypothetical protein
LVTSAFVTKNVGASVPVGVSGYGFSGTDAGDYVLQQPIDLTAAITPVTLTISGVSANNKTFDGNTTATLNLSSASLQGVLSGDVVTVSPNDYTANFASAGAGSQIPVNVIHLGLGGPDGEDYVVLAPTGLAANITASPASLIVNSPVNPINAPPPAPVPPTPPVVINPTAVTLVPVSYEPARTAVSDPISATAVVTTSGNGGDVGAGDVAQINNGGVNNVTNPVAEGALNQALGPAVHASLVEALQSSVDWTSTDTTGPAPAAATAGDDGETILSGGDVVSIQDEKVKSIPLSQAPQPLQDALGNGVMNGLKSGNGNGH